MYKVEKRLAETYIYNDEEFTKDALRDHLKSSLVVIGDKTWEKWCDDHCCLTAWRKMYHKTDSHLFMSLYKALEEIMEIIKSLDNDVDKD